MITWASEFFPPTPKFRRTVNDSHPRRWGGLFFFPKKWPNIYVVLSLNDPAVDLDDYEHDEEEEESH